jgi:hypothetical protein
MYNVQPVNAVHLGFLTLKYTVIVAGKQTKDKIAVL